VHAADLTAVFDKVTEIGDGIVHPGYRIRVRDQNDDTVFVDMTTRQGLRTGVVSSLEYTAYPLHRGL
jgi:hypothetical protein